TGAPGTVSGAQDRLSALREEARFAGRGGPSALPDPTPLLRTQEPEGLLVRVADRGEVVAVEPQRAHGQPSPEVEEIHALGEDEPSPVVAVADLRHPPVGSE